MKQIVDITAEDARWDDVGIEKLAQRAAAATLGFLKISDGFEISLLACDDNRIAELNSEFRDRGDATNVLSWPSEERAAEIDGESPENPEPDSQSADFGMPDELGDIAISYDTCAREAADESKPINHHVTHLIVHGVLHLLGYDHIREKDADLMEGLERDILETLSIPDPYKT
ncbi:MULTISPECIES: rRNA maturation RNase YbeY [Falsihalocynthiibacter]|uniref:rRNA maturation RNase YbeY n=1 Tax=Falsihalocynthiibacter TaxID=2854182 RepID=UPI003001D434